MMVGQTHEGRTRTLRAYILKHKHETQPTGNGKYFPYDTPLPNATPLKPPKYHHQLWTKYSNT